MRDWLRSYQQFSTVERRGITALVMIITVLFILRLTMHHFITTASSVKTDKTLLAAWQQYKDAHPIQDIHSINNDYGDKTLFSFDPNTLDSIGFIKLGLRPKTTRLLLNWRKKGKVFYKKEDLKSLYTLDEEQYNTLAPYIIIQNTGLVQNYNTAYKSSYSALPAHLDLNTIDSSTLVRLNGIGPFFAHKIIDRRKALGGYIKYDQLMEVWRFSDSTFKMLQEKLAISKESIHKIKINIATEEQLKSHPYIGEKMAKNIIIYRDVMKRFEKIEQIRQAPLMNEEIYRKIAPYLSID